MKWLLFLSLLFSSLDATPKKIYMTPGYWGELFGAGDGFAVLRRLRATLAEMDYELLQAHNLDSLEEFEFLVVFEVFLDQLPQLAKYPKEKLILFLWEPPAVLSENFNLANHRFFSKVFTWNDALVDNKKYFKFYYAVYQPMISDLPAFHSKKLCTQISSNKGSYYPGELYSERRKVIQFFEEFGQSDFDFYGKWWPRSYKNYVGEVDKKVDCLKHYKFTFCYENIQSPGYVTEKIFDCFQAGTVPIYLGAPNITRYVPENCFIAREDFKDEWELYEHLKTITPEEYAEYERNIARFLKSERAELFTIDHFIQIFLESVIKKPS
jgi:hypothetical protein